MRDEILEAYSHIYFLDALQEECGELVVACNKVKRAQGIGFITDKSLKEAIGNLVEEIADVENIIMSIKKKMSIDQSLIDKLIVEKDIRCIKRLREGKEDNG